MEKLALTHIHTLSNEEAECTHLLLQFFIQRELRKRRPHLPAHIVSLEDLGEAEIHAIVAKAEVEVHEAARNAAEAIKQEAWNDSKSSKSTKIANCA